MTRWKKRLWFAAATVLSIVVGLALTGWVLLHGTPDWYQPLAMSLEQREAAAQRATNKLAAVQNEAARLRAVERLARNHSASPVATRPANAIIISFTDEEINAFFDKWSVWQNVKASYERFITDPCIVLKDGRLILAGHLREIDAVASVHFEPRIDDRGRLELQLMRVLGGKLPLPSGIFEKYQTKAANSVAAQLPHWQQRAAIDSSGVANSSAISAVMGQLMIAVLNEHPADPVLFLPLVERGSIPVHLSDVKIEDHSLILTVEPMTPEQRAQLLGRIRDGQVAAVDNGTNAESPSTPP